MEGQKVLSYLFYEILVLFHNYNKSLKWSEYCVLHYCRCLKLMFCLLTLWEIYPLTLYQYLKIATKCRRTSGRTLKNVWPEPDFIWSLLSSQTVQPDSPARVDTQCDPVDPYSGVPDMLYREVCEVIDEGIPEDMIYLGLPKAFDNVVYDQRVWILMKRSYFMYTVDENLSISPSFQTVFRG